MLFDVSKQTWAELVHGEVGFTYWSKDGRHVYFKRFGKEAAIMRVAIGNRKIEEAASLRSIKRAGSDAGFWTGVTPDDSPLTLRDIGTQEIYALDWKEP
jgi:hypothetical protein